MWKGTIAIAVSVLFLSCQSGSSRAADATRPTTRPAEIDTLVHIPPITLKTKGLSGRDAFTLLGKATGVTFFDAKRVSTGMMGFSRAIDLWGDGSHPDIDFDLDGVSFWQAARRLGERANVDAYGDGMEVTLDPIAPNTGKDCEQPLFTAHIEARRGYHQTVSLRGSVNQDTITDVSAGYSLSVKVDPRVAIAGFSSPVIETTRDNLNHDVPLVSGDDHNGGRPVIGSHFANFPMFAVPAPGATQLSILHGYVPVTVVTKPNKVVWPLQVGAKAVAGPWTIELVDIGNESSNLGRSLDVFVGIERTDPASSDPFPLDLNALVQIVDKTGEPLVRRTASEPRATVSGGYRERIAFWDAHADQTAAEPDKVEINIPQEIKPAALPFEFKDVALP
jgi:hypothetical protein